MTCGFGELLQSLARELVSSRKVVGRLYENRAQLNSVSMHLGESVGKAMISPLEAIMSRSLHRVKAGTPIIATFSAEYSFLVK